MVSNLEESLKRAFIDDKYPSSHYDPKIIVNQPARQEFLLTQLHEELKNCQSFFFSVAFITQSGLNSIKTQLMDLHEKGIKGKIITSTYLLFNDPDMFLSLLSLPNVEIRLSEKKGFHPKGYLFKQEDSYSLIVGSSNLTMSALKINYEWNIRLSSYDQGEVIQNVIQHMETEWVESYPLTDEWIASYRKLYQANRPEMLVDNSFIVEETAELMEYVEVIPNSMQKQALLNLEKIRNQGEVKSLIVSATGTGKTYLAAFEVRQYKPKKMLFIVHREQILEAAMKSFKKVIGGPDSDYGILSGTKKETNAKYLFSTIQSMSKDATLADFNTDYFDYIIIDEVHRSGAQSYLKVLDYFTPNFLLGMTATPERTDGYNIFELFDYNVAYEIRLQDALEEDLLCPFHYFGVVDYIVDGERVSEGTDLYQLTSKERVAFLLEKINYYGVSGREVKGLVFCRSVEESRVLSEEFTKLGHPATYLSGAHSIADREQAIIDLETGSIEYIFTVDVFNEGIDIPCVNQVIMLRNTQSNIVFVQQLGRGLRKSRNKKIVTVIDFIGNYKNNYMIPMALSGDQTLNKNNLRKDTFDTSYITGLSAINFEEIAKEQIFESINQVTLDSNHILKADYLKLKNRLGRIPLLIDFVEQKSIDPLVIARKYKNYYQFLLKLKEDVPDLKEESNGFLTFITDELLPGYRKHEIYILGHLLNTDRKITKEKMVEIFKEHNLYYDKAIINSVWNTLNMEFYAGVDYKRFKDSAFFDENGNQTETFLRVKNQSYFRILIEDLLEVALIFSDEFFYEQPLTIYRKYRRRDTLRLLNWEKQLVNLNIGGYTRNDNDFVIFITLDKGEDFKGSLISYENLFLNSSHLRWYTKTGISMDSPVVKDLLSEKQERIHLFVQKYDDKGNDFYYLGLVEPVKKTIKPVVKKTAKGEERKLVEAILKLQEPVDVKLYNFFINR